MASDSEITAFRTNGLGIGTVLAPVLVLSVLVSAVTAYLAIEVEHRTKRQLRNLLVSSSAVCSASSTTAPSRSSSTWPSRRSCP